MAEKIFRTIPSGTTEQVTSALREAILSGELAPGHSIRQDVIAQQLGVSKIPVREALRTLEAQNLVFFTANRGATVCTQSLSELADVYALRSILEPYALQNSIPYLSELDLQEARHLLEMEKLASSHPEMGRYNRAFHEKLSSRFPSEYTKRFLNITLLKCETYSRMLLIDRQEHLISNREHFLILSACSDGDVDLALSLLKAHLDDARTALAKAFTAA